MDENLLQVEQYLQGNPLEFHLRTFAISLLEDGYRQRGVRAKLRLLADLGRWLERTGRAVTHVEEGLVDTFLKQRKRVCGGDSRTLQQFLDHLRKGGLAPEQKPVSDQSPLTDILSRYEAHLRSQRGLAGSTVSQYQYLVRKFLTTQFRHGSFLLKALKPSDISDFVLRHTHSVGISRLNAMTAALRSFFRYLLQKGELQRDLAASVPRVVNRRLSTVPRHLPAKDVERLLKAPNRLTAIGRRDYAILLLLARLALRAGEVVRLRLEDINWRSGEILVRGKGLFQDRMPLLPDVGKALANYLRRGRPVCRTRRVFICMKPPFRGLGDSTTVAAVVRRALAWADLHPTSSGAHLLRHSLATSLIHSGATLGEIGEILRHRAPNSTEIYAKVDFDGLRSLAHPWPMGGAQ
jgi:site-specific recombinase XerD